MSSFSVNSFYVPPMDFDEQYLTNASQQTSTVKPLLVCVKPVYFDELSLNVLKLFINDQALTAVAIVNAEYEPIGLIDRGRILELFVKPFTKDLYYNQTIAEIMNSDPIITDVNTPVDDIARIIIEADMKHMVTGFIITQNGLYLGLANGRAMLEEITHRKQRELYFLAHYDQLTRIPNRTLFNDRLKMVCLSGNRDDKISALVFIDLDRFKNINDTLGHSYGDQLLVNMAQRLITCVRASDTVARLGGDEFVIILQNLQSARDIERLVQIIIEKIQSPMDLLGIETQVTASIGIALYPLHDRTPDGLIRKADLAMYQVKQQARNGYVVYSDVFERESEARQVMEAALKHALNRHEFSLFYQPQIHLESNCAIGVEALIRWHHPVLGLVSPAQFIPLAEKMGLIVGISEWVILEACKQHLEWITLGLTPIRIALNISAIHFHQNDFCQFIQCILVQFAIDPAFIELELTEGLVMNNTEHVIETMTQLRTLGVKLAIDDFGTGYSCLSYLRQFPFDRIKIDQSFIRHIEKVPANEAIVRAIMMLGESLGLEVVAEGVETIEELGYLRKHHCHEVQGFYLCKPIPAIEIEYWYQHQWKNVLTPSKFNRVLEQNREHS